MQTITSSVVSCSAVVAKIHSYRTATSPARPWRAFRRYPYHWHQERHPSSFQALDYRRVPETITKKKRPVTVRLIKMAEGQYSRLPRTIELCAWTSHSGIVSAVTVKADAGIAVISTVHAHEGERCSRSVNLELSLPPESSLFWLLWRSLSILAGPLCIVC